MSVMWTPLRLTMSSSSSPQISKRDSQTKTTSLSQGKLNSLTNHLQEETILEKQTVRISPSAYKRNVPISTFFANGHHKSGGISSVVQSNEIRHSHQLLTSAALEGATPAIESALFANSNSKFAHKECQTETYLSRCNIELNSMEDCADDRIYPENDLHDLDTSVVDHENEKLNELSQESDLDSKDRELEHIDAIISESKYASRTSIDRIDSVDQLKQNGSVFPSKTKTDTEDKLKKDIKQLSAEEEEEDSCCMNCFLVTLNLCECVIL